MEHDRPETAMITGATGFVGRELVRHLLQRHPQLQLIALVRGADAAATEKRRAGIVQGLPRDAAARLSVARGDMTQPDLGLDASARDEVLARADRVLHCAASVRFDLPLAVARRENVDSTRSVLSLCRALRTRGRSGRLDYVSTAFVAGHRDGIVGEEELNVGQSFRNTYERTKLEAEQVCRDARADVPVAIHRPSIVVGQQSSGETSSYKALYGPLRLLVQTYGAWSNLPARLLPLPLPPDLHVDVVPVDHVAAAIAVLWNRDDAVGRCFHLAAGVERTATVQQLADITCEQLGMPRVRAVAPGAAARWLGRCLAPGVRAAAPRAHAVASILFDYGLGMPRFDISAARAAGLVSPSVVDYFGRILSFAVATGFGRAARAARVHPACRPVAVP